jgi:hypothetical protein
VVTALKRAEHEDGDLTAKKQVQAAFSTHGFRKGSRQITDSLVPSRRSG